MWKDRVQKILDGTDVYFTQNPPNVMYERACETVDTCRVDQRSFKGYLARWMADTTQMAPFTYDQVMTKLQASAVAAAKTCTAGPNQTTCGLKWTAEQWDGSTDLGQEMAVLEVIQSNLITRVAPPVTSSHGGTSKGNPNAGGSVSNPGPHVLTMPITTGDRAGAGILTVLMMITIGGSAGFLVWD